MQLPSKKKLGLRLSLATALMAALGSLLVASPASALTPPPDPKVAAVSDAYIKTQCRFTVTSANFAAGTVRGRMTAKTSWAGQLGFKNLAHVSINCYLYNGDSFAFLAQIHDEDDARATYETELVTVPLATSYVLCVDAAYTLRNGNLGFVPFTCAF